MKERPILFSAPMVRALLAGTKTQTRRALRNQPGNIEGVHHPIEPYRTPAGRWNFVLSATGHGTGDPFDCPYGVPGDRLWVREAWRTLNVHDHVPPRELSGAKVWYEAQDDVPFHPTAFGKLRPSMFMPRWASRLTLEVTEVRVERLQDIRQDDARAEGAPGYEEGVDAPPPSDDYEWDYCTSFRRVWEAINGPESWAANPLVWCVSFRRITQ